MSIDLIVLEIALVYITVFFQQLIFILAKTNFVILNITPSVHSD